MVQSIFSSFQDATKTRSKFRNRYYFSLVLALFMVESYAGSTEVSLSLSTAIQRTIGQNPTLKVFEFRQTALRGELETARLKPAYELEFEAENFAGSGNLSGLNGAELTIALSSVIEMGHKQSARIGLVSQSQSALTRQQEVMSLELMGNVTRRYVEVLAAQERVLLATEALKLANDTLKIVKARAKAGATPGAEIKRAVAAQGQAQLSLQAEQQRMEYLSRSLAAFWGENEPSFSKVEGNLFAFGVDSDFESLYARVEKNPAMRILYDRERVKDAELRLAKTESTANIHWSVGVRHSQELEDTSLVASFSMPLFAEKRNSGAVSRALAERSRVSLEKEATKLRFRNQLFRAYSNRKQAILSTQTLQSNVIPALDQALKETQAAYKRGRYSYLEYVSARQELLVARRALIDAASAALIYGSEIEQLTRESLTR